MVLQAIGNITMINNEIKQFLQDYYEARKDVVEFIFLGGSGCLPYINSPHDLDIYVVYKKYDSNIIRYGYRQERQEIQDTLKNFDSRVVIIRQSLNTLNFWKTGNAEGNVTCVVLPTYVYQTRNYEIIAGEDSIDIKKYSVLKHKTKFKETLKNYMPTIIDRYTETGEIHKSIYHILTGLYILSNNSYDLTEEQIQNINDAHDGNCTLELYNWVCSEIDNL